jgi:molecular chaperone DnaK
MTANPLYVGIDLGTSNSTVSIFDGENVTTVRNGQGGFLTPSVVRLDSRKNVQVGARARRFLDGDPENTRCEFKRLMGADHVLSFPASGVSMTPTELSAEVLKSLRQDVAEQFGVAPERAVVSVPALFELHQTAATAEAARLAGFERVELIQEPVASAIAAGWTGTNNDGPWLVYDLGGGTFDVSLLETQDGLLRVVGHDGDNFLGGRDFDRALVDLAVESLRADGAEFDPRHARLQPAIRRMRAAAEDVKIELTRASQAPMFVPGLDLGEMTADVDLVISRSRYEVCIAPLIDRSIEICLRLMRAHGLGPDALDRLVLVGGPTMTPFLRDRVRTALGAPIAEALDPMTLVSQGAALFAGTLALDGRPAIKATAPNAGPKVWLQYPTVTADLSPYVVGKLIDSSGRVKRVRIARSDGGWTSDPVLCEVDGAFVVMARLPARQSTSFVVIGEDGDAELELARFTMMQGGALGEPPLSRSVGVALADDGVQVFFARGAPLPIRRSFMLQTAETVNAGSPDHALKVPIVQGEFTRAHHCRLVGTLEIPATDLPAGLPAGSHVELMLELDRGGALHARARVVKFDLIFDQVAILITPRLALEALDDALSKLRSRTGELSRSAFLDHDGKTAMRVSALSQRLDDLERNIAAAGAGDLDAGEQARREISDYDAQIAEIEADLALPALNKTFEDDYNNAFGWVGLHGDDAERKALAGAYSAAKQALGAKDPEEAQRQLAIIRRLRSAAFFRDPTSWASAFESCASELGESTDIRRATELVAAGREAVLQDDRKKLEQIVRALWAIRPVDREVQAKGHGSGLRSS